MMISATSAAVVAPPRPTTPSSPVDEARSPQAAAAQSGTPTVSGPPPPRLIASKLFIELDEAADRYVQTHLDPADDSVLGRFPSENQLAFSRGVNAYVRALQQA